MECNRLRGRLRNAFGPLLVVAALTTGPAWADAENGLRLARQWCTSCHTVEPGRPGVDAATPFVQMANDPAYTPDRLRGWLAAPHPPMPNLDLARQEIADIVDYLESLKRR